MSSANYLSSLALLPTAATPEERASLWRQGMATLAQATQEQQPVPLEGIDPQVLLSAVRVALQTKLFDDLDWLSPPAAAAAIYELAAAIPMGDERRDLGRQVLTRLYAGDAETFVALATSLAAESRRTLTGPTIRARVALALELPIGGAARSDALALALLSRPDLRREWLSDPATGSLPSRRLAARVLERAARESVRRAVQGDTGSLRAFEELAVLKAWRVLLADRESLVWRHVAVARGLLSRVMPEMRDEIEAHLSPELTPTEWRRAAVSATAAIAVDPQGALKRCQEILNNGALRSDNGLAGTMVFGLAQAAEAEPESAETLLNQLVRVGGLEAAEALAELSRSRRGSAFGKDARGYARGRLESLLVSKRFDDDGRVALCEALVGELSDGPERPHSLRDHLDEALNAFEQGSAREAVGKAHNALRAALGKVAELEGTADDERDGRRRAFVAMRELDVALLECATLGDLLQMGANRRDGAGASAPLDDLYERITTWLLDREGPPLKSTGPVPHLTLRLRRMRTLLHLVDADGSHGADVTGRRKQRRLRIARTLLTRASQDAPSPLRRIVGASLARTCDALVRDEVCELSDVIVASADHVRRYHDLTTLAEASMMPDFRRCLSAYAELSRATVNVEPSGRSARLALDLVTELARNMPWASTVRVTALRKALMNIVNDLEVIAAVESLPRFSEGTERAALLRLQQTIFAMAQLTLGARRRLLSSAETDLPRSGEAVRTLEAAVTERIKNPAKTLTDAIAALEEALSRELPLALARAIALVLRRMAQLPLVDLAPDQVNSFVPPTAKEAPLPPWMPARRTLGGFYVVRALGAGGVGSVFVVVRAEERHQDAPVRFALKVPDYGAEAARTLSEDEFLTLFREEAGALLSLPKHKNLAGFVTFDAGARPKPILVMELVEGPTLERTIERGELSVDRAFELLDGVGAGLEGMHEVGLGHLDLKPSNVILRQPRRKVDRVDPVLVDFGLAGRHIRPGCATGPYGAPEIWGLIPEEHAPTPMASDTYAYACLTYELVTGEPLFDGTSEMAVINMHLNHDGYPPQLLSLRERRPELETFCDLVAHGLRQHPAERISVSQMRRGLAELRPGVSRLRWPLTA